MRRRAEINRHARYCVNISPLHPHLSSLPIPLSLSLFSSLFFFVSEWFRESNSFFTARRFNSTNSIFHPRRCRGFNWAQGVSIFVECNMQSSDLSNQILVCCRLHSLRRGDGLLISFIRYSRPVILRFADCRTLVLDLITMRTSSDSTLLITVAISSET